MLPPIERRLRVLQTLAFLLAVLFSLPVSLSIASASGDITAGVDHDRELDAPLTPSTDLEHRRILSRPEFPKPVRAVAGKGWRQLNLFGGNIAHIAVSPVDPDLVLAGSQGAYASFVSRDGGRSWNPIDFPPNPDSDYDGPMLDVEFASDGTPYIMGYVNVFRGSKDARSWARMNGLPKSPYDLHYNQYSVMAINPHNANELWIGVGSTLSKLMRTVDGGATWADVSPPAQSDDRTFTGIAFNQDDPSRVVATSFFLTTLIQRTLDGGTTWSGAYEINESLGDVLHDGERFYMGISNALVFASDDDGVTWAQIYSNTSSARVRLYDLAFDPDHPGEIFAALSTGLYRRAPGSGAWSIVGDSDRFHTAAVDLRVEDQRGVLIGTDSFGVKRSDDNGEHFTDSSHGLLLQNVARVISNPSDPDELVACAPGADIIAMYTTVDGGNTWTLAPANNFRFDVMEFGPDGVLYAAVSQPHGTGVHRREADGSWTRLWPLNSLVRIAAIRIGHYHPNVIFAVGYDESRQQQTIFRTVNSGATWQRVHDRGGFLYGYTDLAIADDGTDQHIVVSQAGLTGALVSHDQGTTWAAASGLASGDEVLCRTVRTTPADPRTFYAIAGRGNDIGLHRSNDRGDTWQALGTLPGFDMLAVDGRDANIVYAVQSRDKQSTEGWKPRSILRSADGGNTFSDFAQGIEYLPANLGGIAWQNTSPCPTLLMATSSGVFARLIDSSAPEVSLTLEPNVIWPPDHKMKTIHARVKVDDDCDSNPDVLLKSIVADDGTKTDPRTVPLDVRANVGTHDMTFELRAERPGKSEGRRYIVTYTVTDASGNSRDASATVLVPHDGSVSAATRNGEDRVSTPTRTELVSIEPNPFNPATKIHFTLARAQHVAVHVHDVRGARVRTLVSSSAYPAGVHRIIWDGVDDRGTPVASGTYFVRLVAGNMVHTMKALLIK